MIIVPVEKRIDWKRPPIVLLSIVVLNILIFAFYQSSDIEQVTEAVALYESYELEELEINAFRSYMRKVDPSFEIDQNDATLIWRMASDEQFAQFLEEHQKRYIPLKKRSRWKRIRAQINEQVAKISSNAFGLDPNNISVVTLITHQFLHGGIDHLLGNMVFLLLTGFAVEAALGSKRFLAFYLVSGIGSGLLFSGIETLSGSLSPSLIGASGAISGVMAMYVVLFGMRKIEFFYWLFVFTGYFRAAAIIMLPAYILKELYMLFFGDASNVAYMAHVGGFLTGAALVYIVRKLQSNAIDDDYLDNAVVEVDPYLHNLQTVYNHLGQCEFKQAYAVLKPLKQADPNNPELNEIEFNIFNALNGARIQDYLVQRIGKAGNGKRILIAQLQLWNRMKPEVKSTLSFEQKAYLLGKALELGRPDLSEAIYAELETEEGRELEVATLARRIAIHFQKLGREDKTRHYDKQARGLMEPPGAPA
jgi:membrane associated rhomboid family serine protease